MESESQQIAVKRTGISGSERRQKGRVRTFRLSPEENAELEAAAERLGLTVGSFIRTRILTVQHTRQQRRPPVELAELARLQAALNRIGGNIHQILKRTNFGELVLAHEYHEALAGYREAIDAILAALGRRRAA